MATWRRGDRDTCIVVNVEARFNYLDLGHVSNRRYDMCTRSQNYTIMVVGDHGIHIFKVCRYCVVAFVVVI